MKYFAPIFIATSLLFSCSKQSQFEDYTFSDNNYLSPVNAKIEVAIQEFTFDERSGIKSLKVTKINGVEVNNCVATGDSKLDHSTERTIIKIVELSCQSHVGISRIPLTGLVIGSEKLSGILTRCVGQTCTALENKGEIVLLGSVNISGKTISRKKK